MPDGIGEHDERRALVLAGLSVLDGLLGHWVGAGHDHGAPVTARLIVTPILDGTFVEAIETLLDPGGQVLHEDRALYRYDPDDRRLKVMHFVPGGWFFE